LGFVGGILAISFGGLISVFAGWMLAHSCEKTNASCFEEVAKVSFGKKAQIMTSICMISCNAGFLISYQVLVSVLYFLTFKVQIFHAILNPDCYW